MHDNPVADSHSISPARGNHNLQIAALTFVSLFILWCIPAVCHYSPDTGIYIGTAESLAENGAYTFNGHPNLQYYPGLSGALSVLIRIFGTNYYVLNLFGGVILITTLWMIRAYFPVNMYGITALVLPVLIAFPSIMMKQAFQIQSDGLLLCIVMAALLFWKRYSRITHWWPLTACVALTAIAPLVRLQGVFLCVAFGAALILKVYHEDHKRPGDYLQAAGLGLLTLLPFGLWTLRNFLLSSPDTFSTSNKFFFGLRALKLYTYKTGPDSFYAKVELGAKSVWHALENISISLFGPTLVSSSLGILLMILSLAAILLGTAAWWRRSSRMEQIFVVLVIAHLIWFMTTNKIYPHDRYWLPVLPFLLVSAGLGIERVYRWMQPGTVASRLYRTTAMLLVAVIVARGVDLAYFYTQKEAYFRNTEVVLQRLADYVDRHVKSGARIATTDWGVAPRKLRRQSYPVLNDASHMWTMARMVKYETRYLVILDGYGVFTPFAHRMVANLSDLFSLLLEVHPDGAGPAAAVYEVDLERARRALIEFLFPESGTHPSVSRGQVQPCLSNGTNKGRHETKDPPV